MADQEYLSPIVFLYCIRCECLKYSQNSQKLPVLIDLKMSETKLSSALHRSSNDVCSAVVSEVALSEEVEFYWYKIYLALLLFLPEGGQLVFLSVSLLMEERIGVSSYIWLL